MGGSSSTASDAYLPLKLVKGTRIEKPDTGPGGTYARLDEILARQRQGGRLGHFVEDVTTRMPIPDEADRLRLGPGIPVFNVIRTAYDEQGTPVEVCDMLMAGDRYQLSYTIPAS